MVGEIFQEPKNSNANLRFADMLSPFSMIQTLEHLEVSFHFLM